jgi:hypothetical protein
MADAPALPDAEGDAPAAKSPDHAQDDAIAPTSNLPTPGNDHAEGADGVPGDGATHAGTDTPPVLLSRPCDPVTGKALDGSGQPKGVIVGGSGALNVPQDKSNSFGKNNDQSMQDAAQSLAEDEDEDEDTGYGDGPDSSDDDAGCDSGVAIADTVEAIESDFADLMQRIRDFFNEN